MESTELSTLHSFTLSCLFLVKPAHDEVYVPPPKLPKYNEDDRVPISRFEPWAQTAFEGIEMLNRIQSEAFQSAYKSGENLVRFSEKYYVEKYKYSCDRLHKFWCCICGFLDIVPKLLLCKFSRK